MVVPVRFLAAAAALDPGSEQRAAAGVGAHSLCVQKRPLLWCMGADIRRLLPSIPQPPVLNSQHEPGQLPLGI